MIRNPDTIEAQIWEKLDHKTDQIMLSLSQVMDEPEDVKELVLGMTDSRLFGELFSQAATVPRESVSRWFDEKTSQFGGQDVLKTVRNLVGNCDKFDFQDVSDTIPRLDLPDLKPFFLSMLAYNKRRVQDTEEGLAFKTPDPWKNDPGIRTNYNDMIFDRQDRSTDAVQRILGIGHKLIDCAVEQARNSSASIAAIETTALKSPIFVFRVVDRVTVDSGTTRAAVFAVLSDTDRNTVVLRDWELLQRLNQLTEIRAVKVTDIKESVGDAQLIPDSMQKSEKVLRENLPAYDLPFRVPEVQPLAVLWPHSDKYIAGTG